jgi:hypothetical protein
MSVFTCLRAKMSVCVLMVFLASCVTTPTTRENETWLWVSPTFDAIEFQKDLIDCGEIVNGRLPVHRTSTRLPRAIPTYQPYTGSIPLNVMASAIAERLDKSNRTQLHDSTQLHEHCRFENISGDPCGVFFSCLVERDYRGVPLTQADRNTYLEVKNNPAKTAEFRRKIGTIVQSSDYNPNFKY